MVDDAVAKGRGRDQPVLWLKHLDLDVAAGAPSARPQFVFEPQDLSFEPGHEGRGTRLSALAADRALGRPHQHPEFSNPVEQVTMPADHDGPCDPAANQPADLVDAARGVLVTALVEQLQFGGEPDQEAQLVELQIDRFENAAAVGV
jgi:hypothetical protein